MSKIAGRRGDAVSKKSGENRSNALKPQTLEAEQQLASFMAKFTDEVAALASAIRNEMRALYPMAIELVYDNYNALAIGYGPSERASEAIFSIALYPRWVSLFFLQAKSLSDPNQILRGSGSTARHVVLSSPQMLHSPTVRALMEEAVERANVPFERKTPHRLVIKSVSQKQRPRRPADPADPNGAAAKSGAGKQKRTAAGARTR